MKHGEMMTAEEVQSLREGDPVTWHGGNGHTVAGVVTGRAGPLVLFRWTDGVLSALTHGAIKLNITRKEAQ